MATIAEQLSALSILDTLKNAAAPGSMTVLPWQTSNGSWNVTTGWAPAGFVANPPTGTRSGYYVNTAKVKGDYGVGLKKTTGSLLTAERQFEVWLFYQGGEKASGYQLAVITNKSSTGKVRYRLSKFVEGEATTLLNTSEEFTLNENDAFFLARVGKKLYVYRRAGEGTPELIGEAEDETFTEGYVGFGGNGSNPRLINLQGGALTAQEKVRQFSRSPSSIYTSEGSCDIPGAITMVAIVRIPEATAAAHEVMGLYTSAGSAKGYVFGVNTGGSLFVEGFSWGGSSVTNIFTFNNNWKLIAYTKGSGNVTNTYYVYDFTSKEWKEASPGKGFNAEPLGENGQVRFGFDGFGGRQGISGRMAAAAIWGEEKSKAFLEELVACKDLSEWLTKSPAGMWMFKQASVGEALEDQTGHGANQIATEGTSVIEESPPIPYGSGAVSKLVKVLIGGVIKEVKRWVLVKGELVNK